MPTIQNVQTRTTGIIMVIMILSIVCLVAISYLLLLAQLLLLFIITLFIWQNAISDFALYCIPLSELHNILNETSSPATAFLKPPFPPPQSFSHRAYGLTNYKLFSCATFSINTDSVYSYDNDHP